MIGRVSEDENEAGVRSVEVEVVGVTGVVEVVELDVGWIKRRGLDSN